MANLVDTIKDRMKFPEKLELAPGDRRLLEKLEASAQKLIKERESQEQTLHEIKDMLHTSTKDFQLDMDALVGRIEKAADGEKLIRRMEETLNTDVLVQKIENALDTEKLLKELEKTMDKKMVDSDKLLRKIENTVEKEGSGVKALVEDRSNDMAAKLGSLKASGKDEELLKQLGMVLEQVRASEKRVEKQFRGVKIMTGLAIWTSLLTLAVLVARILEFI